MRAWWVVGRIGLALVSTAALVAVGTAWFTVHTFQANTNLTPALAEVGGEPDQPHADDGATDILLVGDDARTDARGAPLPASVLTDLRTQFDAGLNTDTIILLRLPRDGGKAYAISIPRDTYVPIPGYRTDKINSAYGVVKSRTGSATKGEQALIETVQHLTGVEVDHYVEVNLYGFYLLSKAIGGVQVCLRRPTSDPNSGADFRAGVQTVSGASALSFVRQRDGLPNGDLGRIQRQQVFLAAAARKVLSAGTLTSPHALSGLLTAVRRSVVTDPGLDLTTLLQQGQNFLDGNIEFVTIPVVNPNARSPRGQSIVQVNVGAVHEFVHDLIAPPRVSPTTPAPPTPARPAAAAQPASSARPARPKAATPPVSERGVPCVD